MLLTCSLLASRERKLLFFSSSTLRVSFSTVGEDAEPNPAIGSDDKSGFREIEQVRPQLYFVKYHF